MLSLAFSQHTGLIVSGAPSPFAQASGYIAAQRNIVALDNYQPTARHNPIIFRPNRNPYPHITVVDERKNESRLEAGERAFSYEPPHVDFLTYPQRTGGHVDYVLVWDVRHEQRDLEATHSIFTQLQAHYELVIRVNGARSLSKVLLSARKGCQAPPTMPGCDVASR